MPVAPALGYGGGGFGSLFGGNNDLLGILFIIALCGGWGGFGGFGGWGMGMGMMGGMYGMGIDYLYPWLNNSEHISDGFRDQQLATQINGIQQSITSGFGDVQLGIAGINQNICQTGNGIVSAVSNGFANAETAANARQMATTAGLNGIAMGIQQGFSDNRAATADVKYTIASEACNTRAANTANTQAILDKLCQLELDNYKSQLESKNDRILDLERQLSMKDLAASQTAQNAFIAQTVNSAIDANYMRFKDCPVGTVPVFGNQPIFTCPNSGTSCGCSGFVN